MRPIILTLTATLLFASTVHANEQIARDNQCFKCHAIDTKKKAPSFQSIAQEFRGDTKGSAEIERTIRKGITSLFGQEKMPANTRISDGDLKALSQWILSQ
jgi:cytochrome c